MIVYTKFPEFPQSDSISRVSETHQLYRIFGYCQKIGYTKNSEFPNSPSIPESLDTVKIIGFTKSREF